MKKELKFKIKKKIVRGTFYIASIIATTKATFKLQNIFYVEEKDAYEKVVDDFKDFLKEENIDKPIDIFDYYCYALWNGYLSYNHKFEYDLSRPILTDNYGMDCIIGRGVCLNEAGMLTDIYNSYGYEAYTVMNYVDVDNRDVYYLRTGEDLNRGISNTGMSIYHLFESSLDKLGKIFGNHAITCVKYNGEYYFYCPTQLLYFEKNDSNSVEIINGEGEFKLKYISSFLTNNTINFKVINSKNHDNYSKEVLESTKIEINEKKLEQFYNEHKEIYKKISRKIESQSGLLNLVISETICQFLFLLIFYKLYDLKHIKVLKETKEYINKINEFLDDNLNDILIKIKNISTMGSNGYLQYQKGKIIEQDNLMFNLSIPCPYIINGNYDKVGFIEEIFDEYEIKPKFKVKYIDKILNIKSKKEIICIEIDDNYYFYDCEFNKFLMKKNNQLDVDLPGIQYILNKKLFINHKLKKYQSNIKEINNLNKDTNLLDKQLFEKFYQENEERIDSIAKKLILK